MKKLALLITLAYTFNAAADLTTFTLAQELLAEASHEQAATEFRRFAMETSAPEQQAAAYLYAGYSYLQDDQPNIALEMIERAEEVDVSGALLIDRTLLNAAAAKQASDLDSALYYYDLITEDPTPSDARQFAVRHAAAIELSQGNHEAALRRLEDQPAQIAAINAYMSGKDKSPKSGGLWGIIPGAGYFYSGEYANGFRSLILNSVFLFGMAHTADNDQWGAFTAITFFELTWYSGSIYGGVDSAHRYNQARLNSALSDIEGSATIKPRETTIPIFQFKVSF